MLGDPLHDHPPSTSSSGMRLWMIGPSDRGFGISFLKGASRKLPLAGRALVNRARVAVSALRLRSLAQTRRPRMLASTCRYVTDCPRLSR